MSYRQGGSTLTQQLAKVLFTSGKKTIKRKIFEAFCAWEIEKNYDKHDILTMYLNLIYFGRGAYGIEEASNTYFNKSARFLSLGEAAMLVGLIPNPHYFNPIRNISTSYHRASLVLLRLRETNKISDAERQKALHQLKKDWQITLISSHPQGGTSMIGKYSNQSFRINKAPHFNERIRRDLIKIFDEKDLKRNGLKIYTTLDYNKQRVAEKLIQQAVEKQRNYHRKRAQAFEKKGQHKKAREEKQKAENINSAMISIDPRTGEIHAYMAGYEFSAKNQLDRITQSFRQPGSSFKPFVYLSAIESKKLTITSIIQDKRFTINGYSPQNYNHKYLGPVTARDALRKSINTAAVAVLYKTGFHQLFDFLQKGLGLSTQERKKRFPANLSIALGSSAISPLEHVKLHSIIANGGGYIEPYGLRYVEDYGGKILHNNEKNIHEAIMKKKERDTWQIVSPQAAYIVTRMMMAYFEPGVSSYRWKKSLKLPFDIGGKTGTTSHYVDAWFVGYTPRLVTSLWMGNDAGNISLGPRGSGGGLMAPLWVNYISQIRNYVKKDTFPVPETGIVYENACNVTGKVPSSPKTCKHALIRQPYIAGTEPGEYCPLHP